MKWIRAIDGEARFRATRIDLIWRRRKSVRESEYNIAGRDREKSQIEV